MTGVGRKNRTRVGQPRAVLLRVDRFCLQWTPRTLQSSTQPRQKREEAVKEREATRARESRIQTRQAGSTSQELGRSDSRLLDRGWGALGKDLGDAGVLGFGSSGLAAKRLHTPNALTGPLPATCCKARPRGDLCIRPPPYLHQVAFAEGYRDPAISGQPSSRPVDGVHPMSSLVLWFVRHWKVIPESLVLLIRTTDIFVKTHGDSQSGLGGSRVDDCPARTCSAPSALSLRLAERLSR